MFGRWLVVGFLALSLGLFVASELSRRFFSFSSDAYVTTDIALIAPVVSGPLKTVAVGDNATVEANALLFEIDPEPFTLALNAAEAALELARLNEQAARDDLDVASAALDGANATVKVQQETFDRLQALTERGVATQQRLDQATSNLLNAQADVKSATAGLTVATDTVKIRGAAVRQAEVRRDQARYRWRKTRVYAPSSGRIAPFQARVGSYATAGEPVLALITNANWRIIANLPEQNLAHLKVGQRAFVMVATSPWRLVSGRVRSIAPGVSRVETDISPLPFVAADTDWIRISQRFPVEIVLDDPVPIPLFRGADARIFIRHTPVPAAQQAPAQHEQAAPIAKTIPASPSREHAGSAAPTPAGPSD